MPFVINIGQMEVEVLSGARRGKKTVVSLNRPPSNRELHRSIAVVE